MPLEGNNGRAVLTSHSLFLDDSKDSLSLPARASLVDEYFPPKERVDFVLHYRSAAFYLPTFVLHHHSAYFSVLQHARDTLNDSIQRAHIKQETQTRVILLRHQQQQPYCCRFIVQRHSLVQLLNRLQPPTHSSLHPPAESDRVSER